MVSTTILVSGFLPLMRAADRYPRRHFMPFLLVENIVARYA